ncbi:hypothetical protein [Alteromonas stellipolaris]|uniref:hypothetical protein n=1 Tax=Alteromonas stellipolaris TaxID=233316 RepID=UPI002736A31F|nr:hypothetical protein [Alteromonas stellipolaris]MDP2538153.1 hypothetical protein [Alteromonas stellipolaris]
MDDSNIIMDILSKYLPILVALVGVFFTHKFTSRRDVINAQRALKIEALSLAYKALVRSGLEKDLISRDDKGNVTNKAIPVEDAIAIIHLHGSELQSRLASQYAVDFANNRGADCTELVNSIRNEIRASLGYEKLEALTYYLSVKPNEEKKKSSEKVEVLN